jgi:hypothetical protein
MFFKNKETHSKIVCHMNPKSALFENSHLFSSILWVFWILWVLISGRISGFEVGLMAHAFFF